MKNGLLAVSVVAMEKTDPGVALIYDIAACDLVAPAVVTGSGRLGIYHRRENRESSNRRLLPVQNRRGYQRAR